jgi:glycosyltransferase involved in cell wall biosynthesis
LKAAAASGCTIADAATFAQAVVLAKSFREFQPQGHFTILLVDDVSERIRLPNVSLLGLGDVVEPGEEWRLPMLWSKDQLTHLLQPALLLALLQRGAAIAAYFASSTQIFDSIDDILELTRREKTIVATETIRNEWGDAGRSFIGVPSRCEANLRSWLTQVEKIAGTIDATQGCAMTAAWDSAFEAQPHRIIALPGFAVSYATLDPKTFEATPNGYKVGGTAVRSFDFRGYDPGKPHLLSKYQGLQPRILLSEYPAVAKLCDEYRERVLQNGAGKRYSLSSSFETLASGLPIDERMRRLYRNALANFRRGEMPEPPSPFGPQGEEGFLRWLNEPLTKTGPAVTRYMLAVLEDRDDVKNAFPDPLGGDAAAFRRWYHLFGQRELDLPAALVPDNGEKKELSAEGAMQAINVAGYFRAELGLGVAARAIVSALDAAGIPFNTISFDATANRQEHLFVDRHAGGATVDINLICVNPDQLSVFAERTGPELWHGRYTIGVWFWEVEDFPKSFHGAFDYVDEIWVASEFMRRAFLKVSPKPVFKYCLPILTPQVDQSLSRADLSLPAKFTFLFSFDLLSVLERKNPLGLIEAFRRAFPDGAGPSLVIKTINGDKRCLEMEKMRYAVRGRTDIILKDGYCSEIENNTTTALADCYVSLHRSEGFGFTIAEAMALGKPVIATAYSGNMEFMTPENSYLCPSVRAEVGAEREPYPADSHWSDPDAEAAAELLRHVYLHQEEARARGLRAAEDIRICHSPQAAAPIIAERIATIRRRRSTARPFRSIGFLEDRLEALEARLKRTAEDTSNA